MSVRIKRAYEPAAPEDGKRYLVDRLWPRGVKKESLVLEGWLKEIAPTDHLRQWFRHDPERWPEFRKRYVEELKANPERLEALKKTMARGVLTLVYSARDEMHNQAVVLRDFLLESAKRGGKSRKPSYNAR